MSNFKDNLNKELANEIAYGENGMPAYKNAGSKCLEFFYAMGSLRGNTKECVSLFELAFEESPIVAIQLAFLLRDVRGGNGERDAFREIAKVLEQKHSDLLLRVLHLIPKYGRWDDLEIFGTTKIRKKVYNLIGKGLKNNETSGLCAKWISRNDRGDKFISGLRAYLKLSPKDFRKMLVSLSSTLEQKMSAKDWDSVDYNKLPSQALNKHTKAFSRNDETNYLDYLQGLYSGESKVNAETLFPYQIVNRSDLADESLSKWALKEAQWKALPDYFKGAQDQSSILPMIDVSASMSVKAGKTSITCMDVAVSLGMYISMKQNGDFQNTYLTFNSEPKLNIFNTGLLREAAESVYESEWGGTTNLEKAFEELLSFAVKNKIVANDMPKVILILSDMNFDVAVRNGNHKAIDMIKSLYEENNYTVPKVVFWNLHHNGTFVAKDNEQGVMTLSGFSPALLKDLIPMIDEGDVSPIKLMLQSIERYEDVKKSLL